ncbi:hypothetical protein [Streptomyces sp. NPDC048185]
MFSTTVRRAATAHLLQLLAAAVDHRPPGGYRSHGSHPTHP